MQNKLEELLTSKNIKISPEQIESFNKYRNLIIEWNKKFNITAITEEEEMNLKHFYDCILLNELEIVKNAKSLIDVGTGGGFPGIPLKILNSKPSYVLMDALSKRIKFLEFVKEDLKLENLELLHARAEELARKKSYRDSFDLSVSRAVASLNILTELCLPFVKVGGYFISMKGSQASEELDQAKEAIEKLGGKLYKKIDYSLSENDHERSLIIIKKIKATPDKYPRIFGKIKSNPL